MDLQIVEANYSDNGNHTKTFISGFHQCNITDWDLYFANAENSSVKGDLEYYWTG